MKYLTLDFVNQAFENACDEMGNVSAVFHNVTHNRQISILPDEKLKSKNFKEHCLKFGLVKEVAFWKHALNLNFTNYNYLLSKGGSTVIDVEYVAGEHAPDDKVSYAYDIETKCKWNETFSKKQGVHNVLKAGLQDIVAWGSEDIVKVASELLEVANEYETENLEEAFGMTGVNTIL